MTETPLRQQSKTAGSPLKTMSEIARLAGVSESTVSRALSGSTLVAQKTRERILKIAEAANFSVNQQARNLALGQTQTIEVIFPIEPGTLQQVSDPFFVDMLAALTDELAKHQYDVLLTKSMPWDESRPGCAYLGGRADGVVFVGQGRHRAEIRDFARTHKHAVAWGAVNEANDHCVVGSDNIGGGRLATEHLLSVGRRSIAFLGDRTLPEIAQRYDGYRQALAAAGLETDESLAITAPFDIEEARRASEPLGDLYPAFDAIFAASDMIALAAIAALRDRGIRAPEDVSIVGFDGIPAGAHVSPALTSIKQDVRAGGRVLVKKIMDVLRFGDAQSEQLPVELVVRQSCGAEQSLQA
ncbi:MAG: LacI family DNA-binding transcriptional regulator [Pseudomonadota bacterium]